MTTNAIMTTILALTIAACGVAQPDEALDTGIPEQAGIQAPPAPCATSGLARLSVTHHVGVVGGVSIGVGEIDGQNHLWSGIDNADTLEVEVQPLVGERIDQVTADVVIASLQSLTMTLWKRDGVNAIPVSLGSVTSIGTSIERTMTISTPHRSGLQFEDVTSGDATYWLQMRLSVPGIVGAQASVVGGMTLTTSTAVQSQTSC